MYFLQKALLFNRAEFNFGEKNLEVTIDDGRLKIGFTTTYHEIGTKRSMKSFPEKAALRSGVAIATAAFVSYAVALFTQSQGDVRIFMLAGALGLLICLLSHHAKFDATKIPIASGNTILVFHDNQHPVIVGEIYKRRKAEMRRLYGEVDTLNHPQLELKKFLWLKEEDVITEVEFLEARQKIEAMKVDTQPVRP